MLGPNFLGSSIIVASAVDRIDSKEGDMGRRVEKLEERM